MIDRKALKAQAKAFAFKNKWNIWKPMVIYYLLVFVVTFVVSFAVTILGVKETAAQNIIDLVSNILSIATLPMAIGITAYVMKLIKGEKMTVKEALLSKYSMFGLIFCVSLIAGLFTALWTILLIVPGIIYLYKMAMIDYILAEDDANKLSYREVMDRSEKLMNGHKMDFFVFELSFIGWILLSLVTFGIALIWVLPYVEVATVMYYEELKKLDK